jgi:tetratricopeptide (TPR) repeat protein
VATGFDEARKQIIFHDPFFGAKRAMSYADFERVWNLGGDRNTKKWALVVVPEETKIPLARIESDPLTHFNLATAYYRRGDYFRAALEWAEARGRMPRDASPYYSLGMVNIRTKDYDRAIACAREAVRLDPRSAAGYDVLGLAQYFKGDVKESLGSLGQALRLDRQSGVIRRHYIQVRDSYIAWSKAQMKQPTELMRR